jgi:ADP-ribosyl-[dinitrogen reductase] hydrolase
MLGAITGDIIGSIYEAAPIKTKRFPLFGPGVRLTDDTVCTVAIADALMSGADPADCLRAYVRRWPDRGYGGMFARWAHAPEMPAYGSWGNGAAMRVSAIAHLAVDEAEALRAAARTAEVSHDHPDAIAGAQATVLAAWLARHGVAPDAIRAEIATRFGYDLGQSVDQIRTWYAFDISCRGIVPPAIICALEASGYEDAVRNAGIARRRQRHARLHHRRHRRGGAWAAHGYRRAGEGISRRRAAARHRAVLREGERQGVKNGNRGAPQSSRSWPSSAAAIVTSSSFASISSLMWVKRTLFGSNFWIRVRKVL